MDDESERLHHQAFLALIGALPAAEGEESIAALLRSRVPIDPLFREKLAEALAPRGRQFSKVRLKLAGLDEGRLARAMRTRHKSLRRGKDAIARIEAGATHREAVAGTAEEYGLDGASIEKDLTYAKRYAAWCARFPGEPNASYHGWCIDYHVASIQRVSPDGWVDTLRARLASNDRKG